MKLQKQDGYTRHGLDYRVFKKITKFFGGVVMNTFYRKVIQALVATVAVIAVCGAPVVTHGAATPRGSLG